MKSKSGSKFFQKLKRKDQFEISSVDISPEKAVAGLAEAVYGFGVATSRRETTDVAPIPQEYLKTLVAIATNTWRAKNKMVDSATGEIREDMKRVDRHIEAICRSLADAGIVIKDHTGDVYDEGQPMKVVASKPTPGLDRKRVSETLLPSIFWNNHLVQNGEIEISTPATTDKPVET
jgi:hypothetical protein